MAKQKQKTAERRAPKYPRVMVTADRHLRLAGEAKKRKLSIAALAEEIFLKSEV